MSGGYVGRILEVDLSSERVEVSPLDERLARMFIGGKGLGAKILYDSLKPGVDPLSPENPLIFATGPLTGTEAPTSGRFAVVTKSPLTGIFLDSQVGGYFGPELKFAGYDALIIQGKADSPKYLLIRDDEVEILEATDLWGLTTVQTVQTIRERHGDRRLRVASIGPAGERLVRFACIAIDHHLQPERGGQAGRGGAGAVMGSKRLKAIAVRGTGRVEYARPEEFREAVKRAVDAINSNSFIPIRRRYGTPLWVGPMNEMGILPTRNFQRSTFERADEITGETMRERIVISDRACYNCPIACGKYSEVRSGKYAGTAVEGPEYEVIALMGSACGVAPIEAVARAAQLIDELGLDGISTGNVIAWAMECYEREIITSEDTGGLDLRFGNADAMIEMVRRIAYREGLGDLLAEGVKRASEKLGRGSERFAMHVKGMELPGYEPRGSFGMALAYATSDRGGCHQRAWTVRAEIEGRLGPRFSIEGRAKFVKETQDERAACFSLVLCDFAPLEVGHFVDMLNAATGFDFSEEEYLRAGERIWNLTRMFNVREGVRRKDDTLPPRLMEEPLPDGPGAGNVITRDMLDRMLDEYYELRGWDSNGMPTPEKLKELALSELISDLPRE